MWGIISCYNKLGSSGDAGLYVIALAIVQPLFHFTDFNLRQIFVTDTKNRWEFRDYLSHRLVCSLGGVSTAFLLALVFYWESKSVINATFFMGLAVAGQSFSELMHALFQKKERFDIIAWSLILRGLLSLFVTAFVFLSTRSVIASLVALASARFVSICIFDFPAACLILGYKNIFHIPKPLMPRFSPHTLGKMTWLGLPLAVNMGLLSLTPQIPRFFLEEHAGRSAVGQFGSMAMLMSVGLMIANSLGIAMSQRFALAHSKGDRHGFLRLTLILIGTVLAIGCAGLIVIPFAGSWILTVAYSKEYSGLTDVFWLIMFGATFGFVGNALGYPITAARKFKVQPLICFIQVAITCLGCYFWVPGHGMTGAAWAVAVANIVHASLFVVVLFWEYRKI